MALSPLEEDGVGFKPCVDESCWTPLNLSYQHSNDYILVRPPSFPSYIISKLSHCMLIVNKILILLQAYVKSKTSAEKEALRYNVDEKGDHQLEVVTLACGLVAGGTLQMYPSESTSCVLSQLTGNLMHYQGLMFLQEMLGIIPLIHIDDVCEAHIFCMEKPWMKGRYLCAAVNATINEIAEFYRESHPEFKITEEYAFIQDNSYDLICFFLLVRDICLIELHIYNCCYTY